MRNNPYALAILDIWVWVSCWFWNFAHNAIAHPLIPFLPESLSNPIHDWTHKQWQAAWSRKRYGAIYWNDEEDIF